MKPYTSEELADSLLQDWQRKRRNSMWSFLFVAIVLAALLSWSSNNPDLLRDTDSMVHGPSILSRVLKFAIIGGTLLTLFLGLSLHFFIDQVSSRRQIYAVRDQNDIFTKDTTWQAFERRRQAHRILWSLGVAVFLSISLMTSNSAFVHYKAAGTEPGWLTSLAICSSLWVGTLLLPLTLIFITASIYALLRSPAIPLFHDKNGERELPAVLESVRVMTEGRWAASSVGTIALLLVGLATMPD